MARARVLVILSAVIGLLSYALVGWQLHPPRPAPVVDLGYAQYTGVYKRLDGLNGFYGIKYAQGPTGPLRWREPVPVEKQYSGHQKLILNATRRVASCSGGPFPLELALVTLPTRHNEDCLALDVVTPAVPAAEKLPVIVQIHGGGYGTGASSSSPGDALIKHSKNNIVYVAIQYRLGLYGFLAGDEIKADGTWNAGLLDQRAALKWVQRHIHKFGGDPTRVTVVGASAGGGSVTLQMMMHGGEKNPPFQAAVAEYPWWTPTLSDADLNVQYQRLLRTTGCSNLSCLRDLPIADLDKAGVQTFKEAREERELASGLFYWGPAVDGTILKDYPLQEFTNGHFSKVPLLLNRNEFEGVVFTNLSISAESDVLDDLAVVWPDTPQSTLESMLKMYPASANAGILLKDVTVVKVLRVLKRISNIWEIYFRNPLLADAVMQRQSFFGDVLINCPTSYLANAVSASGQNVYKMIFKAGIKVHGSTVPYLYNENTTRYYNGRGLIPLFLNSTIETVMRDTLVSFVLHRDPNVFTTLENAPNWPKFSPSTQVVLEVSPKGIKTTADPDANERCEALKVLAQ